MGAGHEDGDRAAGGFSARAWNSVAHVWVSRAGDLRISLRSSRAAGFRGDFRAVVAGQSAAHGLPILAALYSASAAVALFAGRHAALVGSEVAGRVGQAR